MNEDALARISACVHCGLCLEACPTYRELRVEMDSPRGRLHLMNGVLTERIEPTAEVVHHLDQCLECRACETACPAGVQYGTVLELTRTALEPFRRRSRSARVGRWLFFRRILPSPRAQSLLASALRSAQTLGFLEIGRRLAVHGWMPQRMSTLAAQAPTIPQKPYRSEIAEQGNPHGRGITARFEAIGALRRRVALFTGCLADFLLPEVSRAAVRVLTIHGCEVDVLRRERCCGALHMHNGDREFAKGLARENVAAFGREYEAIVSTSAGCGAELRSYGELLEADEAAVAFGARIRDVTELLDELGIVPPTRAVGMRVVYDEPCHLVHAQGISAAPRALLAAIPGLELLPLPDADTCCGSAGTYSVLQPALSEAILARKIESIRLSGADVVVTGNPGCILQLRRGLRNAGLPVRVFHPVEILARAYDPA